MYPAPGFKEFPKKLSWNQDPDLQSVNTPGDRSAEKRFGRSGHCYGALCASGRIMLEGFAEYSEVPVCSTAFSLAAGGSLIEEQIGKYPFIGLGDQTASFAFYSNIFNRKGVSFVPDIEAATAEQILPMIKSDLGIGFVPMDFLEKEDMRNLVILNMEPAIPPRNICMLKRTGMTLSVAAAELEGQISGLLVKKG